jgi:hypothetical protein
MRNLLAALYGKVRRRFSPEGTWHVDSGPGPRDSWIFTMGETPREGNVVEGLTVNAAYAANPGWLEAFCNAYQINVKSEFKSEVSEPEGSEAWCYVI